MANQIIPQTYEPLVQLFEEAARGARQHGAAVGLKQNTEVELRVDLEALTGRPAGPGDNPPGQAGLKASWNAAKSYKVRVGDQLRIAREDGRELASACVNALKVRLGKRWSSAWESAGFAGGTLEISQNPLTVLQQLRAYFAANPTHEVPNITQEIHATAAACHAAAEAIAAAAHEVNQSELAASEAKEGLDAGLRQARRRLSGLREELARLIPRDDKRWYAFGFDRPSDPQTPEVPANLRATPGAGGSGSLLLEWDAARRAESYRVLVRDTLGHVVVERLVSENQLTLTQLAVGQTLAVIVSARNDHGGESQATPAVTVTLG